MILVFYPIDGFSNNKKHLAENSFMDLLDISKYLLHIYFLFVHSDSGLEMLIVPS